jgi:hypothetical protein
VRYLEGAKEEEDRVARRRGVEGAGVEDAVQNAAQLLHHGLRLSFVCVKRLIIIVCVHLTLLTEMPDFTCGSRFSRGKEPITTRSDRSNAGKYDPSGGKGLPLAPTADPGAAPVPVPVPEAEEPRPLPPVAPLRR